jgi:hypothetical protein
MRVKPNLINTHCILRKSNLPVNVCHGWQRDILSCSTILFYLPRLQETKLQVSEIRPKTTDTMINGVLNFSRPTTSMNERLLINRII